MYIYNYSYDKTNAIHSRLDDINIIIIHYIVNIQYSLRLFNNATLN